MGRLRALLSHTQQTRATSDATARHPLSHVAHPRECDTRQPLTCVECGEALSTIAAVEHRRVRLLTMLGDNPARRYALLTDTQTDSEAVLVDLAIRNIGTCQLRIPKAKYDGVLLLDLIEKHGATVH